MLIRNYIVLAAVVLWRMNVNKNIALAAIRFAQCDTIKVKPLSNDGHLRTERYLR